MGQCPFFKTVEVEDAEDVPLTASTKLERTLGYGRFQFFQVWVFSAAVCFIGAMNTFQLVFFITRKDFRCALPSHLENSELVCGTGWQVQYIRTYSPPLPLSWPF